CNCCLVAPLSLHDALPIWLGDDFSHQGAFRLSYGFEYAADMELSKDGSVPVPITRYDTYDWYLAQGPLGSLTRLLAGKAQTWTRSEEHTSELQSRENLVCR